MAGANGEKPGEKKWFFVIMLSMGVFCTKKKVLKSNISTLYLTLSRRDSNPRPFAQEKKYGFF